MEIQIVKDSISSDQLKTLAKESFGDMVKAVVDLEQKILAIGGSMHADAEAVLLEQGSKQEDLWGINLYPDKSADQMIEFESLINIRPAQGNRSMNIEDEDLRDEIKSIVTKLIKYDS